MPIILYARVSTERQAERELSIPAQINLMQRYASEHGLVVVDTFHDIASGTSLTGRPGLMTALQRVKRDRSITGLLVHKLDRLSRNTFNYFIVKGKLKSSGARLLSVVEPIEETPSGAFLEQIMAAQAEFYSANLSLEVKKGLHEKLRRGEWNGRPPLGYLRVHGKVVQDPARARFVIAAFEKWSDGTHSLRALAKELYESGLVSCTGKPFRDKDLWKMLRQPFYFGQMVVAGQRYSGIHKPLISKSLFEKANEVTAKRHRATGVKRRHFFLLARKVRCPKCATTLTSDYHSKPSGKIFRYYRCWQPSCRFGIQAKNLEEAVLSIIARLKSKKLVRDIFSDDEGLQKSAIDELVQYIEIHEKEARIVLKNRKSHFANLSQNIDQGSILPSSIGCER